MKIPRTEVWRFSTLSNCSRVLVAFITTKPQPLSGCHITAAVFVQLLGKAQPVKMNKSIRCHKHQWKAHECIQQQSAVFPHRSTWSCAFLKIQQPCFAIDCRCSNFHSSQHFKDFMWINEFFYCTRGDLLCTKKHIEHQKSINTHTWQNIIWHKNISQRHHKKSIFLGNW